MSKTIPYHPLLAAVLPVLLLFSANINEVKLTSAIRLAAVAALFALIMWGAFSLALNSRERAAILTTGLILYAATLLPVARVITDLTGLGGTAQWIAGGVWSGVWAVLLVLVARSIVRRANERAVNRDLNVLVTCIALVPLANVLYMAPWSFDPAAIVDPPHTDVAEVQHRPDVYYIIPDGYARADILAEFYEFDNGEFLDGIRDMGFRVCEASNANHVRTVFSLPSSMNMSHITPPDGDEQGQSLQTGHNALLDNAVMRAFSKAGYTTVAYETTYSFTQIKTADVYKRHGGLLNEFEGVAAETFFGPLWRKALHTWGPEAPSRYEHITSVLKRLGEERARPEPVFVFAHVVAPHPTFVFTQDGSARPALYPSWRDDPHASPRAATVEESRAHFVRQTRGVNTWLLNVLQRIIDASDEPCIIIVQSDHGPESIFRWQDPTDEGLRERFGILNAWYGPQELTEKLYPDVTPVNSFRLVLNYCLGTDLPLLEDRSYFSTLERPYDFVDVTERIRPPDRAAHPDREEAP